MTCSFAVSHPPSCSSHSKMSHKYRAAAHLAVGIMALVYTVYNVILVPNTSHPSNYWICHQTLPDFTGDSYLLLLDRDFPHISKFLWRNILTSSTSTSLRICRLSCSMACLWVPCFGSIAGFGIWKTRQICWIVVVTASSNFYPSKRSHWSR